MHRHPTMLIRLSLAAALLAFTAGACACAAGAASGPPSMAAAPPAATGASTPAAHAATTGVDWAHCLQVIANLRARPPADPLVLLLGGSAARESTVSDSTWEAQISGRGGPATATYNLGSRNRTLAQDIALIKALPRAPGIVFIGVNVGRFTSAATRASITLPQAVAELPAYRQHQYSSKRILTAGAKRQMLQRWLSERYPVFKANYATAAQTLERTIVAAKNKGLHPVLLDLPRNMAVIGHSMDRPIGRYRATCTRLAAKYGIPFVSLNGPARLRSSEFYDLWHLVEPGRITWQRLLSGRTAALLTKYALDGPTP